LRAIATVASFGYMQQCHVFMDLDGDIKRDSVEPHASSDQTGFYSIVYRDAGYVVVQQSSVSYSCVDHVTGTSLSVPMFTILEASMATPLTAVGWVLMNEYAMQQAAAGLAVQQAFGLSSKDIWAFDAYEAYMFGKPPDDTASLLCMVRQAQVLQIVSCSIGFPTFVTMRDQNGTEPVAYAVYAAIGQLVVDQGSSLVVASRDTVLAVMQDAHTRLELTYDSASAGYFADACTPPLMQLETIMTPAPP
jgi:hypothetical protein